MPAEAWRKNKLLYICQWSLLIQPGVPARFCEAGSSSDADTAAAKKPSTKNVPKRGAKTVKAKGNKTQEEESEEEQKDECENKDLKASSETGDAKTRTRPALKRPAAATAKAKSGLAAKHDV